ncbi:hypothetical protein [Paenibacillus sp.]
MKSSSNSSSALPDIRQELLLHVPVEKVWEMVSTAQGLGAW